MNDQITPVTLRHMQFLKELKERQTSWIWTWVVRIGSISSILLLIALCVIAFKVYPYIQEARDAADDIKKATDSVEKAVYSIDVLDRTLEATSSRVSDGISSLFNRDNKENDND